MRAAEEYPRLSYSGARLVEARKAAGLSTEALAERISSHLAERDRRGVSPAEVKRWERGKSPKIDPALIACYVLGIDFNGLAVRHPDVDGSGLRALREARCPGEDPAVFADRIGLGTDVVAAIESHGLAEVAVRDLAAYLIMGLGLRTSALGIPGVEVTTHAAPPMRKAVAS